MEIHLFVKMCVFKCFVKKVSCFQEVFFTSRGPAQEMRHLAVSILFLCQDMGVSHLLHHPKKNIAAFSSENTTRNIVRLLFSEAQFVKGANDFTPFNAI